MNQKLLALYGLKWNPFSPELPIEAIYVPPRLENFCWRIEHAQIRESGFAMIYGDPGTGKSVALRLPADRLGRLADVTVGAVNHPQSNLADLYRELGDIVAGFELEADARKFWDAMRTRFEQFALELHGDKTRLLEFDRYAAQRRQRRELGKPETFTFLRFILICGTSQRGGFVLQRKTRCDRRRVTLQKIKAELRQRMHDENRRCLTAHTSNPSPLAR